VLPLVVIRNPLGGYVTTGLFGAYGPILADSPEAGRALVQTAQGIAEAEGAGYLLLKALGDEPLAAAFSRRDLCVTAMLPLADDPQVLWRGFRDKIRNSIRKAQKSPLEVRVGPGELPGFYDVLAENMHRKGTPIYGIDFMRELVHSLGERAEVVTLWSGGGAVSAALVVYHGRTVYVPFASSRPSSFHMAPNNLLYWEIIERACARGMKILDFGRSPRDASTLKFKLGWGASITPLPYYLYTAHGKPPRLKLDHPGLQFLVRLWQRLPRSLADVLGPSVCSHFLA
jgi:FemAB-related protein (PEP-CTERM system-associated)